jgi:WD40 repeat protein
MVRVWDVEPAKEVFTLKPGADFIYSVAGSPDGMWLASGNGNGTADLWEAASGKKVRTLKVDGRQHYLRESEWLGAVGWFAAARPG